MLDPRATLEAAGLHNAAVADYVSEWAAILEPEKIEVISAADDERLIAQAMEAGEIQPAGDKLYYSRSYFKDTARSEERTVVATSRESDRGTYNNWRAAEEVTAAQVEKMRGAYKGKTMYVIPYLMAPVGSPLEKWARGVEITDNRTVVMHMIRMARVGVDYLNTTDEPEVFVRAVHVTGDLENLGQGTDADKRLFATVADQRTILHFGSSYGGNALLGKIAHGLRQAAYDGWVSGEFLSEQFMLIGIKDKVDNRTYYICGGFPSASGKTNLAMMLPPNGLEDRYEVFFYGDDIVWLRVDPKDGRLYGMNPEYGAFGVAKDTNWDSNPTAMEAVQPGTGTLFTGGNALLGKIAHGLRQAAYDGWVSGEFLSEQFMLIGIKDKVENRTYYVCGGFPSASGKTNLAMMLAPNGLDERYEVYFYGDDIVWLRVDPKDGRLYGMNPEYGAFGVAKDTNWESNPTAMEAVQPGTGTLFTNVAYNPSIPDVWWEGKTPDFPEDVTGWLDWKGEPISPSR